METVTLILYFLLLAMWAGSAWRVIREWPDAPRREINTLIFLTVIAVALTAIRIWL